MIWRHHNEALRVMSTCLTSITTEVWRDFIRPQSCCHELQRILNHICIKRQIACIHQGQISRDKLWWYTCESRQSSIPVFMSKNMAPRNALSVVLIEINNNNNNSYLAGLMSGQTPETRASALRTWLILEFNYIHKIQARDVITLHFFSVVIHSGATRSPPCLINIRSVGEIQPETDPRVTCSALIWFLFQMGVV